MAASLSNTQCADRDLFDGIGPIVLTTVGGGYYAPLTFPTVAACRRFIIDNEHRLDRDRRFAIPRGQFMDREGRFSLDERAYVRLTEYILGASTEWISEFEPF